MSKKIFKKRYILGEGYPWAYGKEPYKNIGLVKNSQGVDSINLVFPSELWKDNLPKYRLVLERVN